MFNPSFLMKNANPRAFCRRRCWDPGWPPIRPWDRVDDWGALLIFKAYAVLTVRKGR